MLFGQHARGERILIVAGQHWHGGLDDDRTMIELRGDEMHRAAVYACAGSQRLAVGVQSGKRRQ